MKDVTMFMIPTCPHCKKAMELMAEVCAENPQYKEVVVKKINETQEADYAAGFDYFYVPAFYVDGVKKHEGVPSKEAIRNVYRDACE